MYLIPKFLVNSQCNSMINTTKVSDILTEIGVLLCLLQYALYRSAKSALIPAQEQSTELSLLVGQLIHDPNQPAVAFFSRS